MIHACDSLHIRLTLLTIFLLIIFSPAFFGEISVLDDDVMIRQLQQLQTWSFKDIFTPGAGVGMYYRPFIGLSQVIDRFIFNFHPVAIHAENIVIHIINTILVYLITRHLAIGSHWSVPMVAALIFGVHPLTTESVNWISGRTDLLAGMFMGAAALVLMRFRSEHRPFTFVLFSFLFLCGIFSKEVTLAFLPGAVLMLLARNDQHQEALIQHNPHRRRLQILLGILAASSSIALFFWLRSRAFSSNLFNVKATLLIIFRDAWDSLFVCLRTFGFYIKKMFIPYPLNLAIMEVDPLYELLAIPLVIICVIIALKRSLRGAVFSAGIFLMSPAFLIAFGQIAWTPYAERYMYLPLMLMVPSIVTYLSEQPFLRDSRIRIAACAVILIPFTIITLHRNVVWLSNEALLADTIEKSPNASLVWYLYAGIASQSGDNEEALRRARKAVSLRSFPYDPRPDILIGDIYAEQQRFKDAIFHFAMILRKTGKQSGDAKSRLQELLQNHGSTLSQDDHERILELLKQ